MKKLLLLLTLLALPALADPVTRVYVTQFSGTNEAVSIKRDISLSPQTPMAATEVARKPYNYSTPRDFVGVITNEFDEVENQYAAVPQKYWEWDGNDIIAMTQQERADRDALLTSIDLTARLRDPLEKALQDKIKQIVSNRYAINPPYTEGNIRTVMAAILTDMNQARIDVNAATNLAGLRDGCVDYMQANSLLGAVTAYLLLTDIISDGDMQDAGFGGDYNP